MKRNLLPSLCLTLVLLTLLSIFSKAQINRRDIVYLKNGSVIKGIILEMVPNESLKLKTSDGSIFIYKMEEVEKTEKEESSMPHGRRGHDAGFERGHDNETDFPVKGYFILARVGPTVPLPVPILDGGGESYGEQVSVSFINGYQVNKFLSLGIGVETNKYSFDSDQRFSSIRLYPVYLDTRLYVPRKTVQPMFSMQLGYAFAGNQTINYNYAYGNGYNFIPTGNGGTFFSLGAGVRIKATYKLSFLAEGGFSLQTLHGYENSQNPYLTSQTFSTMKINVGVMLNLGKKEIVVRKDQ